VSAIVQRELISKRYLVSRSSVMQLTGKRSTTRRISALGPRAARTNANTNLYTSPRQIPGQGAVNRPTGSVCGNSGQSHHKNVETARIPANR
jgi:hypothetical protein